MCIRKNFARRSAVLASIVASAVMAVSQHAAADASDYNYLQAAYINGDVMDIDVDGWQVDGSFRLGRSVFIAGRYFDAELNQNFPGQLDYDSGTVSLGYIFGANETGSVYGMLGARKDRVRIGSPGSPRDSEEGLDIGIGARMNLSREAELKVALNYVDLGENFEMTIPSAELVYSFTPNLAGMVNYEQEDDFSKVGLGVRFHF